MLGVSFLFHGKDFCVYLHITNNLSRKGTGGDGFEKGKGMEILVDSRQMKQCDKNTIEYFGVPSLVLMERAALCVAEEIEKYFHAKSKNEILLQKHFSGNGKAPAENGVGNERVFQRNGSGQDRSVLLVCGLGNNGGDGLAVGRMLWQKGYPVTVVMLPKPQKISEQTRAQMEILEKYGIPITDTIPQREFAVTVDALFGIGLTRNLEGVYREYIVRMNEKKGLKVAVDIPSGIHADTGEVMGVGFCADVTVTFAFAKTGMMLYPGAEYAGEVLVKDIGIDQHSFLGEVPSLYRLSQKDLGKIPKRRAHSNKGSYGKVLTVAGHKNMAGAAFLSGKASYVTGAGLVKIFTEETNRVVLQQLLPEAILATYEAGEDVNNSLIKLLEESLSWASVIVAGPGLGTGECAEILVKTILEHAEVPVVLDADGLNVIAGHLEWLKEAKAPVIVTPHLGEMARLVQKSIFDIQKQLLQVAQGFAEEYNVICVLKDARTITALPDKTAYINTSGNNGMATAGAGDVLTGIVAGLIAQGMDVPLAAPVGVYLHGMAADQQAARVGTYGLMAQDIIEGISKVLRESGDFGND